MHPKCTNQTSSTYLASAQNQNRGNFRVHFWYVYIIKDHIKRLSVSLLSFSLGAKMSEDVVQQPCINHFGTKILNTLDIKDKINNNFELRNVTYLTALVMTSKGSEPAATKTK